MEAIVPENVSKVLHERAATRFEANCVSRLPLPDPRSPILISVLKDEILRIRDFLTHYREAGIERFAIIDNGSQDGTFEFLTSQLDVDLYRKEGPFHWIPKQGWINFLIAHYGFHRWYVYADADELIVFDGIGDRSFGDLTREMERMGLRRVRGFLIDMYSDGPLLEARYQDGESLIAAYPYFDPRGYEERVFKEIISVKGGPRVRVFGKVDAKLRPELTKYPLFTVNQNEYMVNPHHIWPLPDNFISPRMLGVLHFKFLPDLSSRIRKAIELKNYWDASFEYRCYLQALEADRNVSLRDASSVLYRSPDDLIAHGLIEPIQWEDASGLSLVAQRSLRVRRARLRASSTVRPIAKTDLAAGASKSDTARSASTIEIADSEFVGFLP